MARPRDEPARASRFCVPDTGSRRDCHPGSTLGHSPVVPPASVTLSMKGVAPMDDEPIAGPSRMSLDAFKQVLIAASSPAAPEAETMYAALNAAGVRAEILLAFFQHESQFGKLGIC